MKKIITALLIAVMAVTVLAGCTQQPKKPENYVYVSVFDGEKVVLAWEIFELKDEDNDGKTTINDALITAHSEKCKDGFASAEGQYGLYITKLWGDESGAFGYYLNDASAMGLSDEVKSGDRLYAYIYSDKTNYSDAYSYFDTSVVEGKGGSEITVKLYCVSFDENWAPVSNPLPGAVITVDGKDSSYSTGADGSVKITLPKDNAVISARSAEITIIPPVLVSSK